MASLVLLASFIAILLLFQRSQAVSCWRSSFLAASLVCGLLVTAITEVLSLFRAISYWSVAGLWLLILIVALILYFRRGSRVKAPSIRSLVAGLSTFERSLLAALGLIAAVVAVLGWIAPPNNWDSLSYHMSRVAHWIQNRSVANYPTNILRQLHQNPQAEFAILNLQILTGSDRLASMVQWFSMIGSMVGVSLLAKQFGASLRGQIFAAVVAGTLPMGILQGSSTQNDYVVAFWLICLVYYAMLLKSDGDRLYALATGASLGLAILAKGTAYLYAFPFMVWVGLSLIKSRRVKGLALVALVALIAVAVNTGHYTRNYELYRSPIGPGEEGGRFRYQNDAFTISSATSNAVRNVGLQIGTPFNRVNAVLENGIYQVHRVIGIDPNDPRSTWGGMEFHVERLSGHEDLAGNPLHLALIVACIPILFLRRRNKQDARYYSLCLLAAFLLFSIVLKWQPWHGRLQLPLFVLWSPVIGLLLSETRYRKLANVIAVVLLAAAVPWVVHNSSRPLTGDRSIITAQRTEQYFANRRSLYDPYDRAARFLSGLQCSDIGLILGGDDWEYPFWVLLSDYERHPFRLEHVNVRNISRTEYGKSPFRTFAPCAVIAVDGDQTNTLRVGNASYLRASFTDPVGVFIRE